MGLASALGALMKMSRARTILCRKSSLGLAVMLGLAALPVRAELHYLIVGGLGGEPAYAERFAEEASRMASAAERTLGGEARLSVLSGESATRDALREALATLAAETEASDRVAIFLIGHGSYDGRAYKFNLKGPDIDDAEFAELLDAIPARSQLVVNMTSASGAVLEPWTADGRAVITATRSGAERNATRFAESWSAALSSDDADLNKNGSISAQEAFDFASRLIADSFSDEGTLATEHPELRGDNASAFEVALLRQRDVTDPELARLYERRDSLAEEMTALALRRDELGDDYRVQFQDLAVELALVEEQIERATAE
jgi:hypothetical protein